MCAGYILFTGRVILWYQTSLLYCLYSAECGDHTYGTGRNLLCRLIQDDLDRYVDFWAPLSVYLPFGREKRHFTLMGILCDRIYIGMDRPVLRTQSRRKETIIFEGSAILTDRPGVVDEFYL